MEQREAAMRDLCRLLGVKEEKETGKKERVSGRRRSFEKSSTGNEGEDSLEG